MNYGNVSHFSKIAGYYRRDEFYGRSLPEVQKQDCISCTKARTGIPNSDKCQIICANEKTISCKRKKVRTT